jgi:hypothetical protein
LIIKVVIAITSYKTGFQTKSVMIIGLNIWL